MTEVVTLKTKYGTWLVRIIEDGDKQLKFQEGWPEFAVYHKLQYSDLLQFHKQGNSQFNMVVFSCNGVEKIIG